MKVIKPSFEIITPIDSEQILKTIEAVGRTCYKSEDKITDTSCESFVGGIIKRGTIHGMLYLALSCFIISHFA